MSKEKVLYDAIKPKMRKADAEFANPTKGQATTGRFMPAGDSYGVGFRTPVGTEGKVKSYQSGPIPLESVCFDPSEAVR